MAICVTSLRLLYFVASTGISTHADGAGSSVVMSPLRPLVQNVIAQLRSTFLKVAKIIFNLCRCKRLFRMATAIYISSSYLTCAFRS